MNEGKSIVVDFNIPQYLEYLIRAQISIDLWGRGTGKTTGPAADFTLRNALDMPRSNGDLVTPTYEKALTQTLPSLVRGWEKFGYREDVHFFVRKAPPKKYSLPKPYLTPLKYHHTIAWWNGSIHTLISLDKPSTMGNGLDADYLLCDEAKLCSRDKLKEVIPTVRGNRDIFGHLSCHHSYKFLSDMPTNSKGKWLLDYEKQMDKKKIELIIQAHLHLIKLQEDFKKNKYSPTYAHKLQKDINKWANYLNQLRRDTVYVSFASTLDNVHVLGIDAIKNFKRVLTNLEFQSSVLNKKVLQSEDGFYPLLDEDRHGYDMSNHAYIEGLDYRNIPEKDCRWDSDVQLKAPLDISMDHNNKINSLIVGQKNNNNEYWFLNSMFVLKPLYLKDLIVKFDKYYAYHCKHVNYYYDNTSIGENAKGDTPFHQEVITALRKLGWTVNPIYIGQASQHYSRYHTWISLLSGKDSRLPKFRFNKENCHAWMVSCNLAGILNGKDGFKKDKRSETDGKTPPEEATHLSEAGDTLITSVITPYFKPRTDFIDLTVR